MKFLVAHFLMCFLLVATSACTTFSPDYESRAQARKPASVAATSYPKLDCPFFKDLPDHIENYLANPTTVIQDGKLENSGASKVFPDADKQFENAFSDERFWSYSLAQAREFYQFFTFQKTRNELSSQNENADWFGENFISEYVNNLDFVASDVQMAMEALLRMHSPSKEQKKIFQKAFSNLEKIILTPDQILMQIQNASVGWRFDQDGFTSLTCADLESKAKDTRTGTGLPSNFEHYAYSLIRVREMKKLIPALIP